MKKVLAILFAALLIFSFAGCGDDKKDNNKTTSNTNTTVASTDAEDTEDTEDVAVFDGTVEEWLAANKDKVDEVCATTGYTIGAKGNEFFISIVASGYTDAQIEELKESLAGVDDRWTGMTYEERVQDMNFYVTIFGQDSDMPLPEKSTERIYDDAGNLIWENVFSLK